MLPDCGEAQPGGDQAVAVAVRQADVWPQERVVRQEVRSPLSQGQLDWLASLT